MKKIFLILSVLLSGCSCLLSQVPPQRIYAGSSCTAVLPDYRLKIVAFDNCEIASYTQVPAPGFLLTPTNKIATVTVKATDASGNFRQVAFTVTLLDTIKPVLTIDSLLTMHNLEQIKDSYNFGDKLIAWELIYFDLNFDRSAIPGLADYMDRTNSDSTYFKNMMLTWTSPGYAFTGKGGRWHTFVGANDTVFVLPKSYSAGDKTPNLTYYLDYDMRVRRNF